MFLSESTNKISPKKLFLIDGLGAIVSAFMLGVILVQFEDVFGMPTQILYYLASIAVLFSVYSLFNALKLPAYWSAFMRIIAVLNILYCCATLGIVLYLFNELTFLGLLYFFGEITIVISLAIIKLKKAN